MATWVRVGVIVLALLALGRPALAQTCAGRIALGSGTSVMAGVDLGFTESVTAFSGGVVGGNSQVFGGAQIGRVSYDDFDFSTTAFGATVGGQVAADAQKRMSLCPVFVFGWEGAGDIEGSGIDFSGTSLGGGVLFGIIAAETPSVQVVPTFGVTINRVSATFEGFGEEISETDTIGIVRLGVGLVMNKRFAIVPAVTIPFGVDETNVGFSLQAMVGFGR